MPNNQNHPIKQSTAATLQQPHPPPPSIITRMSTKIQLPPESPTQMSPPKYPPQTFYTSKGHPVGPRSRCDQEIRLVLTTFLTPTPTPTICVKETNLVPEPRRTICLMFDSRRESEADSCLISSEIVLLEPQICRQYCRQLSVFSNPASQSQPSRCDDRNSAQNVCYFSSLAPSLSCKLT